MKTIFTLSAFPDKVEWEKGGTSARIQQIERKHSFGRNLRKFYPVFGENLGKSKFYPVFGENLGNSRKFYLVFGENFGKSKFYQKTQCGGFTSRRFDCNVFCL